MALHITTTEMHTGGEPFRIVETGYPELTGRTILDKRAEARAEHDHIRTFLMHEPRGHRDMYGGILIEPDLSGADLAVLFIHNEGYSTMCGHGTIALGRYAVDTGLVARTEPESIVNVQAPCGLVRTRVATGPSSTGAVTFTSVAAFLSEPDAQVTVDGWGRVRFDIAYGGAFYAILPAAEFALDLDAPAAQLTAAAAALTEHLRATRTFAHPEEPNLSGVYGTILTDGGDGADRPSRNVCVFADAQVDRSPTGSGVTARMAALAARGRTRGQHVFESLTGSQMTGSVAGEARVGDIPAVTVDVSGRAYYTGPAVFTLEEDDPLKHGFLLR